VETIQQPMSFKGRLWRAWDRFWRTVRFIFSVNVIGGTLILLCTIIVSYSHSFALFDSSIGYNGLFSHLGVITVETMFLISGYNIMQALRRGRKPGQASIYGFWMGAGFVAWSNVAASIEPEVYDYIYNIAPALVLTTVKGLLLGLAPPASLLISKQIILEAFEGFRKDMKVEKGGESSRTPVEKHLDISNFSSSSTSTLEDRVEKLENPSSGRGEVEKYAPAKLEVEGGDLHTSSMEEVEKVEATKVDMEKVETSTLQVDQEVESVFREVEEAKSGDMEMDKLENGNRSTFHTGGGEKKTPASTSRKKSAGKSSTSTLETGESSTISYNPGDDPLEVALEIMKVEKRRPGRPRLMKAGMSEHTAKKTAKELEKIEKKAS
jgi:hypothetical protein